MFANIYRLHRICSVDESDAIVRINHFSRETHAMRRREMKRPGRSPCGLKKYKTKIFIYGRFSENYIPRIESKRINDSTSCYCVKIKKNPLYHEASRYKCILPRIHTREAASHAQMKLMHRETRGFIADGLKPIRFRWTRVNEDSFAPTTA